MKINEDEFEGKFILGFTFKDGTNVHYILSSCYQRYRYDVENWRCAIRNKLVPEIILSDDLITSICEVHYYSIGNFTEY